MMTPLLEGWVMAAEVSVLVVGGGPTGLLLAAELLRRGVDTLLIDAHDAPLAWDRATVVHPRSIEIFDALGIAEPLLKAGVRQRLCRIHSNGSALGEIDLSLSGSRYPFNLGVSEEVTEAVLTDYLSQLGGTVTRSTRLVDLEERPDGVLATLEKEGQESQVVARWVVGCDGHRSTVRRLAGIGQDGHEIEEPWAVFDAKVSGWPYSHEGNFAYLEDTPIILTALPDERWRIYLRPSAEDSDLVADAAATLAAYLPEAAFVEVANPTRFQCHTRVAQKYRAGRLLLAGDAAHTCSPVQGHGMNSGLQDAFNLGWKLALVARGDHAEALLDTYEAERRPVAQMITASGDEADRAQLLTDPAAREARDAFIRNIFANPDTRHHEAVAEAELDIDYSASPIVLGAPSEALAAGRRWPDHLEVRISEGASHGLNVLANRAGHTTVLVGNAAVAPHELSAHHRAISPDEAGPIFEASFMLTPHGPTQQGHGGIDTAATDHLGVSGVTLFVIRPDGYLGLRADDGHAEALAAYARRLASGGV
ncbi:MULTISPECIES: FAD-dependent monooxygenase [unclassified Xanthobacter]|uniref:FAD-dependent monooxygenase n=1 Tax=unclassified Xanthobacter TaxID=2623496 RepID=UPI001F2D3640|nr:MULTISPECIES: FAD-dependent monooxygenase [unclassified Xanthobacter]